MERGRGEGGEGGGERERRWVRETRKSEKSRDTSMHRLENSLLSLSIITQIKRRHVAVIASRFAQLVRADYTIIFLYTMVFAALLPNTNTCLGQQRVCILRPVLFNVRQVQVIDEEDQLLPRRRPEDLTGPFLNRVLEFHLEGGREGGREGKTSV